MLVAAGGDGTLSAIAGVAVEHNGPLVVVPCGTRNPRTAGQTLLTRRVSSPRSRTATRYGSLSGVNGQVFLDNVSVSFYAAMVRDPGYRRRRIRVAARYVQRAVLGGGRCGRCARRCLAGSVASEQVLVALVSNNAYFPGGAPGSALHTRLDEGMLWLYLLGLPARTIRYRQDSCGYESARQRSCVGRRMADHTADDDDRHPLHSGGSAVLPAMAHRRIQFSECRGIVVSLLSRACAPSSCASRRYT